MAELVEIVNPNGQKGLVAATSDAAREYPRAPSTAEVVFDEYGVPVVPDDLKDPPELLADGFIPDNTDSDPDGLPALNASTETWREYATSHGLSPDEAEQMTRDELVDHFTKS